MLRSHHPRYRLLGALLIATVVASMPVPAGAQIVGTPNATTAAGPRLPMQRVPERTVLPGERGVVRSSSRARDTTIHLSTLAIVVGVVILLILLV